MGVVLKRRNSLSLSRDARMLSGATRNPAVLAEMRRRLPPIFTISTEAVEFDFKEGETYGRYQQRRITRPRASSPRQTSVARPPSKQPPSKCVFLPCSLPSRGSPLIDSLTARPCRKRPRIKWLEKLLGQLSDCWVLLVNQERFLWLFLPVLGILCGFLGSLIDFVIISVSRCTPFIPVERRC